MITTLRILLTGLGFTLTGSAETIDLFDGFSPGWRASWSEQKLFRKSTVYRVIQDSGHPALHGSSRSANSGLIRKISLSPQGASLRLSWRWKVSQCLDMADSERTRSGDDYVARVCVIFENSVIPLRTRSLHYVWSAKEPVGSIYPSPYSKQVGMIVMRSGMAGTREWQAETRNIIADYQRYFGRSPTKISAIGIVVDTDNSQTKGEASFAEMKLDYTTLD